MTANDIRKEFEEKTGLKVCHSTTRNWTSFLLSLVLSQAERIEEMQKKHKESCENYVIQIEEAEQVGDKLEDIIRKKDNTITDLTAKLEQAEKKYELENIDLIYEIENKKLKTEIEELKAKINKWTEMDKHIITMKY